MMGPYFQQPRKKINQKAQGKKALAGGRDMYPPTRHLEANHQACRCFETACRDCE